MKEEIFSLIVCRSDVIEMLSKMEERDSPAIMIQTKQIDIDQVSIEKI